MNSLPRRLALLGLPFLLAACLDGDADPLATGIPDDGGITPAALRSAGTMSPEANPPNQDDYDIVIRDSVNWFVMLNLVETDNNLTRYEGVLYYVYSGRTIEGRAKAVYNSNPDVLTIQCEDPYNVSNPDVMAYGLVFDSPTSRHMRGGWAYLKAKWQGGTAARVLQGAIGAHAAG